MSQFLNTVTDEYRFATCQTHYQKNLYMFHSGYAMGTDPEQYFDMFERLSTIYISRNTRKVIFTANTFQFNFGLFGGAITINSQNWKYHKTLETYPYAIIYDNTFKNNFAYFSGNCIYIRATKKEDDHKEVCGGVDIEVSNFQNNAGMKKTNGGAITVMCETLTNTNHLDYLSTSSFTSIYLLLDHEYP